MRDNRCPAHPGSIGYLMSRFTFHGGPAFSFSQHRPSFVAPPDKLDQRDNHKQQLAYRYDCLCVHERSFRMLPRTMTEHRPRFYHGQRRGTRVGEGGTFGMNQAIGAWSSPGGSAFSRSDGVRAASEISPRLSGAPPPQAGSPAGRKPDGRDGRQPEGRRTAWRCQLQTIDNAMRLSQPRLRGLKTRDEGEAGRAEQERFRWFESQRDGRRNPENFALTGCKHPVPSCRFERSERAQARGVTSPAGHGTEAPPPACAQPARSRVRGGSPAARCSAKFILCYNVRLLLTSLLRSSRIMGGG